MANVNRVLLLGNLGADPELRHTTSGRSVVTLSVATSRVTKDEDHAAHTQTEWHKVVVWDKQAEVCATHLQKGRAVFIEGRLQARDWQDGGGVKHHVVEVVASRVHFVPPDGDTRHGDPVRL